MCLSENDYATPESASGCVPGPQMLIPARPSAVSLKGKAVWSLVSILASIRLDNFSFSRFPGKGRRFVALGKDEEDYVGPTRADACQ